MTLLSVNGQLKDMYEPADTTATRVNGYSPIKIGEPLLVRYLHFYLRHEDVEDRNQLMISTFLKSADQKPAAAEAINYFDPRAQFEDGALTMRDFGGEHYGHPLIYYTKSYRSESLYLTTKIMELDSFKHKGVKTALGNAISAVGALPMFTQYIPFIAMAKAGAGIVTGLIDLLNRDDHIVGGHDLDLHFDPMHQRRLQSGRILCVPQCPESKAEFLQRYRLRADNVLVDSETETTEYTASTYFVIQVDAREDRDLEDFDHFVGAADLLSETNRGGSVADIINEVVDLARKTADIDSIRDMERLSREDDASDNTTEQIMALYKSLSPEVQAIYKSRKDQILLEKTQS